MYVSYNDEKNDLIVRNDITTIGFDLDSFLLVTKDNQKIRVSKVALGHQTADVVRLNDNYYHIGKGGVKL